MAKRKKFTVTDGELVLELHAAEEGGYVVTSPIDPGLVTEADSVEQAFANAREAMKDLEASRAKLREELQATAAG